MKENRGVKRLCATCGTRFFDLMAKPVCPKCQAEFYIPPPPTPRRPPKPFSRGVEPARIPAGSADDVPENDDESPVASAEDSDEETTEETETTE